jgi:hypothetical protein
MDLLRRQLQVTGQFVQGPAIHLALELDDAVQRNPVLVPAPGIEFGMVRVSETDVAIPPDQAQQVPDLFLPAIDAAALAAS